MTFTLVLAQTYIMDGIMIYACLAIMYATNLFSIITFL